MEATSDRTAMGRPGNYRRGGFLGKPLVPGRACATADVDLALLKLLSSIPQVVTKFSIRLFIFILIRVRFLYLHYFVPGN
uniref:Uncharacterized protein n=1 Tax=Triticum urartu TaxID=4572 RepID=A0A8R7NY78_TRIUA